MNIIQKYKLYRNVRDSINSVGHMRSLLAEQYSIIEDDKEIACTHYYNRHCLPIMQINDYKNTEYIHGRFARIMFNLLEKKNRKQVKSR